jgi:hypothetical protein
MNEWPTASSPDSPDVIRPATKALTKTSESNFAVPEPSSAILMCCGLAIFALIAVRRC